MVPACNKSMYLNRRFSVGHFPFFLCLYNGMHIDFMNALYILYLHNLKYRCVLFGCETTLTGVSVQLE